MLRVLQDSLKPRFAPFCFDDDLGCGEGGLHDYTNPLARAYSGYSQHLVSASEDRDFGPLGTIGLHINSSGSFNLPDSALDTGDAQAAILPESLPHSFLFGGHRAHGTRFRVRMTDPTDYPGVHDCNSTLDRTVELVINETYAIRFERRHQAPTRHYTLMCTRVFGPVATLKTSPRRRSRCLTSTIRDRSRIFALLREPNLSMSRCRSVN